MTKPIRVDRIERGAAVCVDDEGGEGGRGGDEGRAAVAEGAPGVAGVAVMHVGRDMPVSVAMEVGVRGARGEGEGGSREKGAAGDAGETPDERTPGTQRHATPRFIAPREAQTQFPVTPLTVRATQLRRG